jgi:predicted nucleic acid-binding protein
MATVYGLNEVYLLEERDIFVDANIFTYQHYYNHQTLSWWMKRYNATYHTLLWQGYSLYTSFEVISELINRGMRIAQQRMGFDDVDFKDFRNSPAGDTALGDIHTIIRKIGSGSRVGYGQHEGIRRSSILQQVTIVEQSYDNARIERLLVIDRLDFVDRSIVAICQGKSYVLFTNDGDFKDSNIEVLTNNQAYAV